MTQSRLDSLFTPAPGVSAAVHSTDHGSWVTLRYREIHTCRVEVATTDPGEITRGLGHYQARLLKAAHGKTVPVAGVAWDGYFQEERESE